jgi:hypothetical protein
MDSIVEYQRKVEIIKVARKQLYDEYLSQQHSGYKNWMVDSEVAWRTRGEKLPTPEMVVFPSEADVIARALELYNLNTFSNPINALPTEPPAEIPPVSEYPEKIQEIYSETITVEPTVEAEPTVEETPPDPESPSISDQLSATYNDRFNQSMAEVNARLNIQTDKPESHNDTDNDTNPEPVVETSPTIPEPDPIVPVQRNTGIQALISKLLKIDQQGTNNV